MSPSDWGPPTWIFLHTLAEKVNENSFLMIGPKLIDMMRQICYNLPCPECTTHATRFWANVNVASIKTKQDLINLLFMFHNIVNKRKKMPEFKYSNLNQYSQLKLIQTYNLFSRNFNTNGNMNLINESFRRNLMLISLKRWLMINIMHFNLS
jgi:hypothetical protein